MKYIVFALIALLALSACTNQDKFSDADITNFEECSQAGFPVMESYPRKCSDGKTTYVEEIDALPTIKEMCEKNNGRWIEAAQECVGITEEECMNLGGNYNECASACRNDPEAEICTMQCVIVCELNKDMETPLIE